MHCLEARGQHQVSPLLTLHVVLEEGSLTEPEAQWFSQTSKLWESAHPHLPELGSLLTTCLASYMGALLMSLLPSPSSQIFGMSWNASVMDIQYILLNGLIGCLCLLE